MADTTITFPAGSGADEELERIASETGRSKVNILAAKEVLARNEPTISLADVREAPGLKRGSLSGVILEAQAATKPA